VFGFLKRMNKNVKQMIFFLMLFCLVFLIWGIALFYETKIVEHYASVSIRLKSEPVNERILMQIEKNERQEEDEARTGITAWNSLENIELECEGLGTTSKVNRIEVYGDMKKVYPIQLVYGNVVAADDYEGCLIDEATAYELFHTRNAVGNRLNDAKQGYCVRGILKSSEPVIIIVSGDQDNTYSNLELTFADQENAGQHSEEFIRKYGLADRYTAIDGYLFARGLSIIVRLPAWLLGFFLIYDLILILYKKRRYPFQAIALALLLILMWPILSWMMEFELLIPEQLIPTKWSDFAFWSDKFQDLKYWMKDFSYIIPYYKDIVFKQYVGQSLFCAATASIGTAALIIHERILYLGNKRAGSFVLITLVECGVIYLLFMTGRIFRLPRAYLAMPIFYMIARDCYQWCRLNIHLHLKVPLADQK
jgi:hypothetical protein